MSTLDLRGAAALMNVHPRTVEAMARDGRLPAANRLDQKVRFLGTIKCSRLQQNENEFITKTKTLIKN